MNGITAFIEQFEYRIAGVDFPRTPYAGGHGKTCLDCGATLGELHEKLCDSEECPRCRGLILTCDCEMND